MMSRFLLKRIQVAIGIDVVLNNIFKTNFDKNVLLVYIIDPFIYSANFSVHQAFDQVRIIAKTFSDLGFNVDVIDYRSNKIKLKKQYNIVFDICIKNNPIYAKNIKSDTKRIVYFTGSESDFANSAELERIKDVKSRRGVELLPRRQAPLINSEVENCDLAIMIGNEYTFATYKDFHFKRTALVPNTGYDFSFVFDKDIKKATSFIYMGSVGSVHKGLDLLLEVFCELGAPYKLYVCGCYEREEDFVKEYYSELYNTDNIVSVGFVDIKSDKFKKLSEECAFTILPSCSEGCAGTITTCMSAGIIPICSRICGYDEDEVIILDDCQKQTIKQAVIDASDMSMADIEKKSREVVELTRKKYNTENYYIQMRKAIEKVL
ncbi:Glycosyltransferase involved in cell wall bisynthesis [Butyrivibrio fibrisolvens]|uniref:Glycosyltransferase involved in cell wall bisynthesis n=2 Tax=Butyrivibrio fibrisolvens TaxID=831 RepID=A0A1H9Q109_BUTFI|nr:Glycosyltransferase involved in cell wall bisynthesis [Butyrivibrio fibrisolvens]